MRILVVQWDYPAARRRVAELRAAGHDVAAETNESGAAYRKAQRDRPDAIVLDLAHLPSRTRQVVRALNRQFGDRLIFVGGDTHLRDRIRRLAPRGRFVATRDLIPVLETYEPPDRDGRP